MTWEYVDREMTIPRLRAFYKSWETDPPVAMAVARFLGYKPRRARPADSDINDLAALGMPINRRPRGSGPPPGFFITEKKVVE